MAEDGSIVTREEQPGLVDVAPVDFDLVAASLRSSSTDLATFVQVLGEKLERALPQRVKVDRSGLPGLKKTRLTKPRRIRRIDVALGDDRYQLTVQGGAVETRHAKAVRGVVLKTEELALDAWIVSLAHALAEDAQASEQSRLALEQMLSS